MQEKHQRASNQTPRRSARNGRGVQYLFRTSPLARGAVLFGAAAAVFVALSLRGWHFNAKPQILSISPQAGMPGDTVTIKGESFGSQRNASTVEFGGYALTQSAYKSWGDSEIAIKLPMNVQDGLVFVRTAAGVSNPAFFSNMAEVPVPVTALLDAPPPVITSTSASALFAGGLLTITGTGFACGMVGAGSGAPVAGAAAARGVGIAPVVYFESAGKRIPASALLGDIESWNDTEIKVRIADGATSGPVTVETANGASEPKPLIVRTNGVKYYGESITYVVRLAADVKDLASNSPSHIRLYFPRPVLSSTQTSAIMTECIPNVADEDYQGTSLRTVKAEANDKSAGAKKNYQEDYAIAVRAVRVTVSNPASVTKRTDMNSALYDAATRADACVPSNDSRVASLSKDMAEGAKGTYNTARSIYNKMLDRFRLTDTKADTCAPLAMLDSGSGDAYDFAMIYTALLRAAGVPALPCSGVIVDSEQKAKPHWWSTFYVAGLGWIPVDVAAGAGKGGRDAGFARLDAQHITFSCGYKAVKSTLSRANIVQQPKSYALQSIWEESTKETSRYSSMWADPVVLGVY